MSDDQQMLGLLKSVADFLYRQGVGDGSVAVEEIVTRYERMKAEWIDPQRIVELAKRYTDEGDPGRVEIAFIDSDPDMCSVWSVDTKSIGVSGSNLSDVLRAAEES